jgi:hypothetical protein
MQRPWPQTGSARRWVEAETTDSLPSQRARSCPASWGCSSSSGARGGGIPMAQDICNDAGSHYLLLELGDCCRFLRRSHVMGKRPVRQKGPLSAQAALKPSCLVLQDRVSRSCCLETCAHRPRSDHYCQPRWVARIVGVGCWWIRHFPMCVVCQTWCCSAAERTFVASLGRDCLLPQIKNLARPLA